MAKLRQNSQLGKSGNFNGLSIIARRFRKSFHYDALSAEMGVTGRERYPQVHRMRRKYPRTVAQTEIAQTVSTPRQLTTRSDSC